MKLTDVFIETPANSREKFNYDPHSGFFRFKKALPYGMCFPFDFGCLPNTIGPDGDPLDIMIISEFKTFTGCVISCRIIGGIEALQTEPGKPAFRNDRFFAIPAESLIYGHIHLLEDLPEKLFSDVKAFFMNYNQLENKSFEILATIGPEKAWKLIEAGHWQWAKR